MSQESPEQQMPLALSPNALAQKDVNAMPTEYPKSIGKKLLDARFRSPTDINMSPASKFVHAKKGGKKAGHGCMPSQLEGNFRRAAASGQLGAGQIAAPSRFGAQK
eukprot:CAMPEP_0119221524 /NCGR_PEP_ID=MMETSP1327-20130426/28546_1 /TAXON_ID=38833 /ORGANISM="Micromonas pusilla, Strain RCC2306" /LENGTH=105 /DNA_ID=CAMNT_0007219695 /DNA_START=181 /DNA_END=498 /DNA_ORIENTATION=+